MRVDVSDTTAPQKAGKTCAGCDAWKPYSEYHRTARSKDGHHPRCKVCRREDERRRHAEKPRVDRPAPDAGEKVCASCRVRKPFGEFTARRKSRDGLSSYCRSCSHQQGQQVYAARAADPEWEARWKASNRAYRSANLERILTRDRAYDTERRKCPEYRARKAESDRRWREANAERQKHAVRRWMQANPEKVRGYMAAWAEKNPDYFRDAAKKRRALKRGVVVETVNRADVIERYGLTCYLCTMEIDPDEAHVDHVTPLSRGGAHGMSNVRPTHERCNLRKYNKLPSELVLPFVFNDL